ncbi:hypothetical protein DL770_007614 [Monosporascus sp. CRB-9-2]|nr:hypothetical protein DL770_007614 [Monosporascus sp. CRB-9-2]
MANQLSSLATGPGSSAQTPTSHPQHEDEAPLREHRLEYLFQQRSNEDFTAWILGGASSHDRFGSIEAKLEKLEKQIGKTGGNTAQTSGKVRKEQKEGQ